MIGREAGEVMSVKQRPLLLVLAAMVAAPSLAQQPPRPPRAPHSASVFTPMPSGRSYLGVDITDVTSDRVAPLKLKEERGVEIIMVDQDAPAAKAGLKEHDVVLEMNGIKIESEEQFRRLLRETPPGRSVTLDISRDGQPMKIQVQLADRKKMMAVGPNAHEWIFDSPEIPAMPEVHVPEINIPAFDFNGVVRTYSSSTGVMVENLTPQLGQFFGVKDGEGVLVRSVEKGSAAEAGGLRAGDVIIKLDGRKVSDQSDWRQALRARKSGKVTLNVIREKREQTLTLNLPEPKRPSDSSELMLPGFDELSDHLANMTLVLNQNRPEMERALAQLRCQTQQALEHVRKDWNEHRKDFQKALDDVARMADDLDEQ